MNPINTPDEAGREVRRLAALARTRISGTPADPAFDRLTAMAAKMFQLPVAGIGFVEADRVWFKSVVGIPNNPLPRAGSLNEAVIQHPDGVTVQHSGVSGYRFSAGAPLLTSDGQAIGAFFVADRRRRTFSEDQERLLADLAALAMREVALWESAHREQADYDPLTGLLNHRAFHKRFQEEIVRSRHSGCPLTMLLLDLRDFRFLNETYGHAAGDDVLRHVAGLLSEQGTRRGAVHAARFGGDEFAVLFPAVRLEHAKDMAGFFTECLEKWEYRPPGYDMAIPVTVSAAGACYPDDGAGRRELVAAAEGRLRQAQSGVADTDQAERLRALLTRSVDGFSMLDALVTAVDSKDRYTRRHSEDVLFYCWKIAEAFGLDETAREDLAVAALLHDVGKIGVPDHILRKPGKLTDPEFAAVRHHPLMGSIIVGAVPGFENTLDAIRHHHERWDGQGYPFGLAAEEIPPMARIMAVADSFSAMTTDRPYRRGMTPAKALALLAEGSGAQWDPACVSALRQACAGGAL